MEDATKLLVVDSITLFEAATLAGVSKRTLQNHMSAGTAPAWVRKGREVLFDPAEVRTWADVRYPAGEPRKGRRA